MLSGSNLLIFDEPTNHLDMESITALNEGMSKFKGIMLFSSHDHQLTQTVANRIIDIKNYSGDPWVIPNKDIILQCITEFETKANSIPPSYTLDIAVRENGVVDIIEIHDFFSCGTYGFSEYEKYPLMLWRWFKWFTKNL